MPVVTETEATYQVTCDLCDTTAHTTGNPLPAGWAMVPGPRPDPRSGGLITAKPLGQAVLCPTHVTAYNAFWTPQEQATPQ